MALADTLIVRALEQDGLSFGNKATRRAYLLDCYPGDRDEHGEPDGNAVSMGAGQSSCLLHCRGVLAADECDGEVSWHGKALDVLRCPYHDPSVFTQIDGLLFELGRQKGVLVTAAAGADQLADIGPANIVTIGSRGSAPKDPVEKARWLAEWGGLMHGILVTGVRVEDGVTFIESVEGGRLDAITGNSTAIERVERRLERRAGGHHWLVSANGGARRLNWRLRAGELPCVK